ncbi:MAG: hypothetical protein JXB05_31350 [Myxococcaceae bacterium]|nr:hypothetical protein [Myxococcaceae bacterium]
MTRTLRSQGRLLTGLTLATLLTLGCEPPEVVSTQDRQQRTRAARIEGNVIVQGSARGNAVVFLYAAERPPPPQGSGRPVAFALIPKEELFGSDLDTKSTGPFAAPFTFPLVSPGRYLLRGFIDVDTCRAGKEPCHGPDFIPWFNVTAEPNVGDVPGAAVDPQTLAPRVVEVREGEDGTPLPVLGVSVSFSEAAALRADRPSFVVEGATPIELNGGVKTFKLRAAPMPDVNLTAPVFLVRFMDEDRDGAPDDTNKDGIPELWPRVVIRKLANGGGIAEENDLDNNGQLDAKGVEYTPQVGTSDGEPDLVVLAAGLVPTTFLPELIDSSTGQPRMDAVIPASELTVAVRPSAINARDPSNPVTLAGLPAGRYAVIVIQSTGQVWRVPNELSPELPDLGLPKVESQGFSLQVPSSP